MSDAKRDAGADITYEKSSFYIKGPLDFATVVNIWNKSLSFLPNHPAYSFDLSQVTSVNSAALALLIEWWKYAKKHKKAISFKNIPEQLISIAAVAGIEKEIFTG